MNEFMKTLLSLSVSGTLLLLMLLALKRLYQNKFSRRWQYYILVIVALRFLLPFTPDTTLVGSLFEKLSATIITGESAADADNSVTININGNESGQAWREADSSANVVVQCPLSVYVVLFLAWAVVALVLLVRKIMLYQRFIRYIRANSSEVSDLKTLNVLADCEEKLKIRIRAELHRNGLLVSPVMIGFFRPVIVLPAGELEEKELSYICMHELIHYRQKDMFYKWLIQLVVCAHWFNPFVRFLEKEVNRACELSCDESVISTLDEKARREYGDTLLSFLQSNDRCKSSLASMTLTEGAEQLKERLGAIMNFRKKTKLVTMLSCMTAFLLSVSGFAIGAYAASPALYENRTDLTGYIAGQEDGSGTKENMSIVHERADILRYEDGSPYIHDILTNHTNKRIVETEYGMTAYNEEGLPLKLRWNFLDSSAESSYENLVRTKTSILPDQTEEYRGGWSLYDGELTENLPLTENGENDQVAYSLFCLRQVVFEDGRVWNNPDYEAWVEAYAGREISVGELQSYYPYQYELESGWK